MKKNSTKENLSAIYEIGCRNFLISVRGIEYWLNIIKFMLQFHKIPFVSTGLHVPTNAVM